MSNVEKPEIVALQELEDVVLKISEELDAFRRRALRAEAARNELVDDTDMVGMRQRIVELEAENDELHQRVERARSKVTDLLTRLEFLEEQMTPEQAS